MELGMCRTYVPAARPTDPMRCTHVQLSTSSLGPLDTTRRRDINHQITIRRLVRPLANQLKILLLDSTGGGLEVVRRSDKVYCTWFPSNLLDDQVMQSLRKKHGMSPFS